MWRVCIHSSYGCEIYKMRNLQFIKPANPLLYEPVHEISNNVVCATSKASDQPAHTRSLIRAFASRLSILWLLHHLEFLRLKGGCTGSSESPLVIMPHCWKSHAAAHIPSSWLLFYSMVAAHLTLLLPRLFPGNRERERERERERDASTQFTTSVKHICI